MMREKETDWAFGIFTGSMIVSFVTVVLYFLYDVGRVVH